ncbi:hypothetical protein D9757_000468 [Collybiopsis confluens]|uniref:Uncharacterized protein n=1 Tax=Collybiopsis confluens TaxID=2823264 RepID=A0A8H5MH22_9AGAR|nr:hypothetical protein D9757_000468 [Collybiopsis confluens]
MVAITLRAESDAVSPTPTPSSSLSSTSSAFPTNSSSSSSATDSDTSDSSPSSFTKNVLQWLLIGVALLVVISVIRKRFTTLRRNGLHISSFFSTNSIDDDIRRNNTTATTHLTARSRSRPSRFPSSFSSSLSHYDLANVPTAYNPFATYSSIDPNPLRNVESRTRTTTTTTCAADIGQGGRRQGGGPSDYDGQLGDKDELPAYDKDGGPPGYINVVPILPSSQPQAGAPTQHREPAPEYSAEP